MHPSHSSAVCAQAPRSLRLSCVLVCSLTSTLPLVFPVACLIHLTSLFAHLFIRLPIRPHARRCTSSSVPPSGRPCSHLGISPAVLVVIMCVCSAANILAHLHICVSSCSPHPSIHHRCLIICHIAHLATCSCLFVQPGCIRSLAHGALAL